ncbi:hypothetical protein BJ322DRAFT_127112 [Thelephora terrestris]|uniref:Uncharacterized protein n=1 Tax=Thelephora terrestris TaxID=56493 RepID=A0A9P6LDE9_9AGAM|nr:hypothetical protein BJ322DRAFT_127112 [Thelephora terrestris]
MVRVDTFPEKNIQACTTTTMTAILNEDILTLIFAHIFDFAVLRTAAVAIKNSNQHPLRSVVLRRLLQLPLRLSSENLEDSKALIKNLVHNVGRAQLVRDIAIVLGPSRKYIAERQEFHNARLAEDLKQAERAEALVESIPELLKQTTNVWHLDWSDSPPPNRETVEELSKNSAFTHLSLDCSAESFHLPDPSKPVGVPGTATGIRTLLSTVGPKVPSLDLRNVDEEAFKVIEQELPPLKNVRNLKLDLTCGVWDWDGSGSPQQGPSEHYRFSRASDHVQELDLRLTDLLARQKKGPLELVDSKKLRKLAVEIVPCFSWTCITLVRLFSDLTSANFPSLTHLVIDDFIRDAKRWSISGELWPADWHEGGRIYVGIHELIASLPQLRHLWVNERVLAVPSTDNEVDVWDLKPFEGESQDTIMLHTVNSPHWESLVRAFENLETLRVGFGQLNAKWVARVLSHCDHTRLRAFGFDWEWQSNEPVRALSLSVRFDKHAERQFRARFPS